MDRNRLDAGFFQLLGQTIAAVLGLAEHQDLVLVALAEDVDQQVALARAIDRVGDVRDGFGDGVARGDLDFARVAHEFHRQLLDRVFERGRKQQGLARGRQLVDDALDGGHEAHVEHAVGFVQDQDFDVAQLHAAAFEMVDQAARRGHQDVDAAAQGIELRVHAGAAVDDGGRELGVLAVGADAVMHLHGEFAGRGQDEAADLARRAGNGGRGQAMQHGQRERRGLAGAGLGAAKQVVASHRERNRLDLDGSRRRVADFGKRAKKRGRKPERFKRH